MMGIIENPPTRSKTVYKIEKSEVRITSPAVVDSCFVFFVTLRFIVHSRVAFIDY